MLVAEFSRQPYDYVGIESSRIREQFSKVIVVGPLQLVFDDNWAVSAQVGSENVQRITAYIRFSLPQLQLQTERCSQFGDVVGFVPFPSDGVAFVGVGLMGSVTEPTNGGHL